jgi:hypothetical protein
MKRWAVGGNVIADHQRRRGARQQGREFGFARLERDPGQVVAVEVQQVEGEIGDARGAPGAEVVLQAAEAGAAFVLDVTGLAVQPSAVRRQLGDRGGDRRDFAVQSSPLRVSMVARPRSRRAARR